MAKKKKEKVETEELVMYATEWSRQHKKDETLYLYYDKKLGRITEEEFKKIKV